MFTNYDVKQKILYVVKLSSHWDNLMDTYRKWCMTVLIKANEYLLF